MSAQHETPPTVDETLAERGARYGNFEDHAAVSQDLQARILSRLEERGVLPKLEAIQREGLAMICHKLGRIANGDPFYDDSWRDIAGYATLVANWLVEGGADAAYRQPDVSRMAELPCDDPPCITCAPGTDFGTAYDD